MANRHLSRSIVLQTLFEWDFPSAQAGSTTPTPDVKEILNRNLKEFAPELNDDNFVTSLIDQVIRKQPVVDEIIEKAAPDWPINKISIVDRNILRIGLTELLFGDRKEVPPKVAINEAIELAKAFGGENSSKFVNGVLGAVYKEIGEPDKEHQRNNDKKRNYFDSKDGKEGVDVSKLPVEKKGGALIYTKKEDKILFALVHDVFGYWTISKGGIDGEAREEEGTKREIKEEIGLDIEIKEKLGENEYVATHPQKGKILKKVVYFLAYCPYQELVLTNSGGLDNARWFEISEVPELRMYSDIIPLITKAIEILNTNKYDK